MRRVSRLTVKALVLACAVTLTSTANAQEAAAQVEAAPAASVQALPQDATYDQQFAHARELATNGRREEAIALYTAMLAQSPTNTDLLLARGRTNAWMKRWPEAEADLTAVTTAKPDYADAWSALGDMYLWNDRPQQAASAYARWAELDTGDPAPVIALGRAHRAAGDLDAARADFAAARARGADPAQVDDYQASLQPRIANQESVLPPGYRWLLRVGGSNTSFSPSSREDWNEYEVSLRRKFARGSVALEMQSADRFGNHDTAWALDSYVSLWDRAYANLRYQIGPDGKLFPDNAWRAELYQGLGQGWEISGSYDYMEFGGSDVDMYGVGVGRYWGNFYARYRVLHVPGVGSGSLSHRAQLRYYYNGNADEYFEVYAGNGRSHELDNSGLDRISSSSHSSFGASYVNFLTPRWGFKVGAGFTNNVDGFDGRSVSASLYSRW